MRILMLIGILGFAGCSGSGSIGTEVSGAQTASSQTVDSVAEQLAADWSLRPLTQFRGEANWILRDPLLETMSQDLAEAGRDQLIAAYVVSVQDPAVSTQRIRPGVQPSEPEALRRSQARDGLVAAAIPQINPQDRVDRNYVMAQLNLAMTEARRSAFEGRVNVTLSANIAALAVKAEEFQNDIVTPQLAEALLKRILDVCKDPDLHLDELRGAVLASINDDRKADLSASYKALVAARSEGTQASRERARAVFMGAVRAAPEAVQALRTCRAGNSLDSQHAKMRARATDVLRALK